MYGDEVVDLTDLTQLLSHFGLPGSTSDGDITGGLVDLTDLATLLSLFGTSCWASD